MKRKLPRWASADEFIQFGIDHHRRMLADRGFASGRGDAVRMWIRLLKGDATAHGIVGRAVGNDVATDEELLELKALLFDWLIQSAPPAAVALFADQRARSERGAEARRKAGAPMKQQVLEEYERLVLKGIPRHKVVGEIVRKVNLSATRVRQIIPRRKTKASLG